MALGQINFVLEALAWNRKNGNAILHQKTQSEF
jgi:hypothetical protein